jgi:hypothetical protein
MRMRAEIEHSNDFLFVAHPGDGSEICGGLKWAVEFWVATRGVNPRIDLQNAVDQAETGSPLIWFEPSRSSD